MHDFGSRLLFCINSLPSSLPPSPSLPPPPYPSLPPSLLITPVTHRLSNGVKTEFLKEFEMTGKMTLLFPKCADEFQQMINVVLYNPTIFTFHYRMRQALVYVQRNHYPHFDKSQYSLIVYSSSLLCTLVFFSVY